MTENKKAQIGVTGLAVMGANLARNLARNGYTVALHNRSVEKTDALLAEHGADGDFIRTESLQELVDSPPHPDYGQGGRTRRRCYRAAHPHAR